MKDKPAIKHSLPSGSVQNNISKEQVNTPNPKNSVVLEKVKPSRKNLVSHSTNYSDDEVNCKALADSVNENIQAYNKGQLVKDKPSIRANADLFNRYQSGNLNKRCYF